MRNAIAILILSACVVSAQSGLLFPMIGSLDAPPSPFLLQFDFEETGTPTPAPSATSGTSFDYDWTGASPAVLDGSQSFWVTNAYVEWKITNASHPDLYTEVAVKFSYYQEEPNSALTWFLLNSTGNDSQLINVTGPDRFRTSHGGTMINATFAPYNQKFYVWSWYVAETTAGSSADGVWKIWISDTDSFSSATNIISQTNGVGDSLWAVRLWNNKTNQFLYDNVTVTATTNQW